MYSKYKQKKFIKRFPGGSVGGADVLSKLTPMLREMIPDQTAEVQESQGKSGQAIASQQAASSVAHNMLGSLGPKGQALSLGLKGLEAGSAAINKSNLECIPDPNSPTGETCFDKSTVDGGTGANLKSAAADMLNPLSTVGNVTDAFTNSSSAKEFAIKMARATPLKAFGVGQGFMKAQMEELEDANDQRKRNMMNAKVNQQALQNQMIAQQFGASQFGSMGNMYAKEGGKLYSKHSGSKSKRRGGTIFKLEEGGKICPEGKAWADRKFKKWSAYAAMAASKYCKDPNYGKGRGKDAKDGGLLNIYLKKGGALKKWRDENWVQSDGTPCGESKAQKNPKRCKPAAKWKTMSESEKKADNAKKKAGGRKGKQFVSATEEGKVTKNYTS